LPEKNDIEFRSEGEKGIAGEGSRRYTEVRVQV
jgi:hypothetical protein